MLRLIKISNAHIFKVIKDTKIGAFVLNNNLVNLNLKNYFWDVGVDYVNKAFIKQQVKNMVFGDLKLKWSQDLERNNALMGTGGNKLRTHRLFKQSYGKEQYISCIRPKLQCSAYMQNLDALSGTAEN